jgi:signal transduction histidine kinase
MDKERDRAVAAIARAQLALEEALEELDAMPALDPRAVALAAHMLNNYLTVTSGTVELIQQHLARYGDPQITTWLEGLQHVTNLMHRTASQLVMNTPSVTEPILRFEKVEVSLMVQRVCQYHQREANKKGILVVHNASSNVPAVRADRVILAAVLNNLLANAVKYSPPGTQVEVRVHDANGWTRCDVQDRAAGLSQDHAQRFQEEVLGSGLAMTQQLIEQMGGKISHSNVSGRGYCFSVLVPQYKTQ